MKKMYIKPITETAEVLHNQALCVSGGSTTITVNNNDPIPGGEGGD